MRGALAPLLGRGSLPGRPAGTRHTKDALDGCAVLSVVALHRQASCTPSGPEVGGPVPTRSGPRCAGGGNPDRRKEVLTCLSGD
jgi:hypothetical protein